MLACLVLRRGRGRGIPATSREPTGAMSATLAASAIDLCACAGTGCGWWTGTVRTTSACTRRRNRCSLRRIAPHIGTQSVRSLTHHPAHSLTSTNFAQVLAAQMVSAFAVFAASGRPSTRGVAPAERVLPFWPAWDGNRSTMVLDVAPGGARVERRMRGRYCHVWDKVKDAQTPVSVCREVNGSMRPCA